MFLLLSTLMCASSYTLNASAEAEFAASAPDRPNIILFLADDLGWAELGCYGQTKIRTPNLDELAAEGMRFTDHYAGAPVCAPSRCILLTGLHAGHAQVRDNTEGGGWGEHDPEGQRPLLPGTQTMGTVLQSAGYRTACVGKWGLGGPDSCGAPELQGFDHFFGYLCQRRAHNFYPTHLWRDGERVELEGNVWKNRMGEQYAQDLMTEDALQWLASGQDEQPFFLYYAFTIPHLALQVPQDALAEYSGLWEDPPYRGGRGYLPHDEPRAAYAAMVTRMDRDVGRIVDWLDQSGLRDDTLILFSSDNGATFDIGGADSVFFDSGGPFRGRKGSVFEGGLRTPLIAHWPGQIQAGQVSAHISAHWDLLPTLAELAGASLDAPVDGISMAATLVGRPSQRQHEFLYWEFPGYRGQQAVRAGKWKAVRRNLVSGEIRTQLYDLESDPGEARDVAHQHPDTLQRLERAMHNSHKLSPEYLLQAIDRVVKEADRFLYF